MLSSGHAGIQVTMERYINDPASLLYVDQRTGCKATRSLLLAASGLEAGPLAVAWSRAGRNGETRIGVVLDRLAVPVVPPPPEHRPQPPTRHRILPLSPSPP